ncbi:MAG TPA: efflux RND transporter permease subunit [Accumulibacter sp.]|uniref:efflux RND transporter permease subunit n=1 Tax=Accumulibacter sp. TaxID=2053492 RepID=UPI002879E5A9|nr:efflux RND transporter permease subunit [Accumulibacter sp.]MDS4055270.1 efflux RND transporter permease subunit [Accumulibacter sp.]HNG87261.1 efflux RND transporter permease subunit [Accumulibacter sp.]HNJ51602.1 efflux RND transporter permease subunit [Accumulibacter sp.]HNK03611.1 efflux RND transporter permease subunit [Accumulibacter sp.]HNN85241.1 efflux RND transporter permease subunit [Accumulibacter sp.]
MKISDLCIRRPVFATVLSLAIMLVGLVSYTRLPVREYPKIDEPVVTVDTTYRGASAEIVESQISKPLEDSLAGIEGVDVITSISRQENSQISVRFKLERNPDSAAADVRDRVSRVRNKLPTAIEEPVIAKVEADANPIIWIAFSSDQHSALEVTDVASRIVKPRLQTLPGAADVRVFGERKFAMRVWLDRTRLAAYRLTPQDVEDALRRQNVEVPAGRIESQSREFSVVARTDLSDPEGFAAIIVKQADDARGSYPVRIADLGRVELGAASERSSVRFNGRPAVALGVIKQATANPLELSRALRGELPKVVAELPSGMTANIAYDSSVFIDRSIDAVFKTIGEAMLLVLLIIFVFLRNFRATLIPLVTIPVSLIGAFALMLVFGFSINTLTLLALVLAIGLVVDDAIVVLENIYRHIEEGLPRRQAAFQGAREIGFAVVAMTITLAAVYAPVAFMTGRTGKLFVEFALTLAGAVLVSGLVALTLSPMMCSLLLRHETRHGRAYVWVEGILDGLTRGYRRLLTAALARRWLVMLAFFLVAAANWFLLAALKSELAPTEDRGVIIGVFLGPEGATLDYTDRYARQLEGIYAATRDVERYFVVAGNPTVSQGISFVGLVDWNARQRSSPAVVKELFPQFMGIPGVLAFPVLPPSLGQSPRERPVNFVIVTSASYAELNRVTGQILDEVAKNPGFVNVDTDLKLNKPELSVSVDRDKAMDTGVQIETVGRTLETMLGGRQVTRFKRAGEQYDVIVQVADSERTAPSDISDIFVRARDGSMIPLSNLLAVAETVSPRELNHFAQRRAVTISANLAPGYAMGEALKFLEETAGRALPPGYAVDYAGQSREFKLSSASLALTFVLALAFIYLVLAAQFESFRDPFIIMLTVPLSMTGALIALLLSGGTLNVYSQIGLVTLVGLITKHGILIVEFANQLKAQGRELHNAVLEASELRLRPILMTTGAMVLGAIPLALASGAGAESRQQIGWVVVGGLLLGTFFTLFVVPTVYTLLARPAAAGHEEHPAASGQ